MQFLNRHVKEGSKMVVDLDQNLFPSTAAFVLLSVSIDNILSDVGVMINNYHHHLREEGGRVFIEELHDSYVGRACNDYNGYTICIHHEQKTSA